MSSQKDAVQKEALPGLDERRRIVEQAQRAGMQARELMERLPAFDVGNTMQAARNTNSGELARIGG